MDALDTFKNLDGRHLIDGRLVAGTGPSGAAIIDPATELKIGQIVHYRPSNPRQNTLRGTYRILNLLPQHEDGEFEYRIRSLEERHELVARESELMTGGGHP